MFRKTLHSGRTITCIVGSAGRSVGLLGGRREGRVVRIDHQPWWREKFLRGWPNMLSAPLSLPRASPSLIKPHVIHLTWPGRAAALINSDTYTHTRIYKRISSLCTRFPYIKAPAGIKILVFTRVALITMKTSHRRLTLGRCTPLHSLSNSRLWSRAKMIYLRLALVCNRPGGAVERVAWPMTRDALVGVRWPRASLVCVRASGVRSRCNCVFMGLWGENRRGTFLCPEHRVPCGAGLQLMLSVLIKMLDDHDTAW